MFAVFEKKFIKGLTSFFMFFVYAVGILLFNQGGGFEERSCNPQFTGTFAQSWLTSSWDEERWAEEIEAMEKDGVKYLVLQDLANKDAEGNWSVYYNSSLDAFEGAAFGGDVLGNALEAVRGSDIQIFVGLAAFDNLWTGGTLTKEYGQVCEITADMIEDIYNKYYKGNEANFYGWYFTMEFSNNVLMQLSGNNIVRGLNVVLDRASEIDPAIPLMMSPFTSDYATLGKAMGMLHWTKIFAKGHWRDGDIFAPQDAVGAGWIEEEDLVDVWEMYYLAMDSCDADIRLWANCENFTSAIAPAFGEGVFNPHSTENVVYVPVTLDRLVRQMDVASYYCENIITFSYTHYYSENQVSPVFIEAYRDYVTNGFVLEGEVPVMGQAVKTATDEGIEISWSEATDNIGISHYRIEKNGEFLCRAETFDGYNRLSCTDASGTMDDVYTVVAYDAAGNASAAAQAK